MPPPYKALVLGDDTRSFLACVRSLGRQGIEVHAAPYTLDAPALASKYIRQVHVLPYHVDGGEAWRTAIQALLEREQYDLVLPCEERALLPLALHRDLWPKHTTLAVPNDEALAAFFDKWHTRQLAEGQQVPVAGGALVGPEDTAATLITRLGLPLVGKHRRSYSLEDLYKRTQVRVLRSAQALQQWLDHNPDTEDLFVEQVFEGAGLGVSVLSDRGQVLQAFEHHRANELAGSSYYRKSMPLDPERLAAVQRLCAATRFTGLAMFEFKLNPAGRWVLLEVNARPWGSLPLPVAWGVDFPYRLFQLLCLDQATPTQAYPAQRYARNLVADLWQLRLYAAEHPGQPAHLLGHVARWLLGLVRIPLGLEKQDVWTRDDPAPAKAEWRQFWRQRRLGAKPLAGLPPLATPDQLAKLWQHTTQQGQTPHLLFLCQGNICRSPYAEHRARQWLAQRGLNVKVSSAGMLPRNHRPAPPQALEAAQARGVDLGKHVSQHAHPTVLEQATWVVVFDHTNYRALCARSPQLAHRVVYLGPYHPAPQAEIADPDGHPVEVFTRTYDTIDTCLNRLITSLPC